MVEEDLLELMDWSKITNLNKETDLAEGLKAILNTMDFNLLDYGVPYFWGNVGILYNKEKITQAELDTLQWDIFKENHKIAFYDSPRRWLHGCIKTIRLQNEH